MLLWLYFQLWVYRTYHYCCLNLVYKKRLTIKYCNNAIIRLKSIKFVFNAGIILQKEDIIVISVECV